MKQSLKQKLIKNVLLGVLDCAECECENGKDCTLCMALILSNNHAEWKLYRNKLVRKPPKCEHCNKTKKDWAGLKEEDGGTNICYDCSHKINGGN